MMVFLLDNGANPNVKEAFSFKSPMTIAKEIRNKEAMEILNKYLGTNEKLEEKEGGSFIKFIKNLIKW
jgi:hypothetical protein